VNRSDNPNPRRADGAVRLLLVEDHSEVAEATAQLLRLAGVDVQIAENGKDALEAVGPFRPQIVLCDLSLPDLSGLDLARSIRSNPDNKDLVFALFSALSDYELRGFQSELAGQVNLVLSKPLTDEKLKKLLACVI
jgi:CheY-like chemotaxis protein